MPDLVAAKKSFGDWSFPHPPSGDAPVSKRSGIPDLENRVKKPCYGLWSYKTKLSQIVTS